MANQPEKQEVVSYMLQNLSSGLLNINTKLCEKAYLPKKRFVTFCLLKEKGEVLLQPMSGFSAKEIFESPGVKEHAEKGLIRKREVKQSFMATKK